MRAGAAAASASAAAASAAAAMLPIVAFAARIPIVVMIAARLVPIAVIDVVAVRWSRRTGAVRILIVPIAAALRRLLVVVLRPFRVRKVVIVAGAV